MIIHEDASILENSNAGSRLLGVSDLSQLANVGRDCQPSSSSFHYSNVWGNAVFPCVAMWYLRKILWNFISMIFRIKKKKKKQRSCCNFTFHYIIHPSMFSILDFESLHGTDVRILFQFRERVVKRWENLANVCFAFWFENTGKMCNSHCQGFYTLYHSVLRFSFMETLETEKQGIFLFFIFPLPLLIKATWIFELIEQIVFLCRSEY